MNTGRRACLPLPPQQGCALALALAAGLLLCPALPQAQPAASAPDTGSARPAAPDREQLDKRLLSAGSLIGESSLSRQIEASGHAGALERRSAARDAHRRALQARDAGDYAAAARLAAESSRLMFEGARLAGRGRGMEDGARGDFAARMQSVKSLLAAQQRISAEKPGTADGAETQRTIETLIAEADRLAAANQLAQAGIVLNKAYLLAKAAVSSMRSGDTLVRSLNFATPQEEYRYELDRNDTHLMLIKALAADKSKMTNGSGIFAGFIDKAAELRRQAEQASSGGDHAAAIQRLEASTRELVRAIRSLGVFIPG